MKTTPWARAARLACAAALCVVATVQAQQPTAPLPELATIRKNMAERLPQLAKVEDVQKTPVPGLYEVRVGGNIFYTDAEANYVIDGQMLDARGRRNLTEERLEKINAIQYADLPLKDAFTLVRGDGKRKLAIFEDPNCGYCKRFERDLQKVDNVTVHVFLIPILGDDSVEKSRHIWCARDKGKAWTDWMVRNQLPTAAKCDTAALERNVEFARRYRITGTPTLVFADGTRVPGAIGAQQVEKLLAQAK